MRVLRHPISVSDLAYVWDSADLDSDGDLDVLTAWSSGHVPLAWHENTDAAATFGVAQPVPTTREGRLTNTTSALAVDLDGDGDLDIVSFFSGGGNGGEIAWYRNSDGLGEFHEAQVIVTQFDYGWLDAADIDGDTDLDIILASQACSNAGCQANVSLYENNGTGNFRSLRTIRTYADLSHLSPPFAVAADVDGDGDPDVISSSFDGPLAWHENVDGKGGFDDPKLIVSYAVASIVADLDGDGDPDLLGGGGYFTPLAWFENRQIGDSNDDGVFDASDLVMVVQVGKYEDGIPNNATFDEGDWNQDGDFDSSDMVMAFETGLYEVQPQADTSEIAAAVDWLFAQDHRASRQRAYVA